MGIKDVSGTAPACNCCVEQNQTEQTLQTPKIEVKFTDTGKAESKQSESGDLWDRYVDGWKEDFKDVDGIVSAAKAVVNRTRKGFKSLDALNPLTYIKKPIKEASVEIDKKVDDGNPKRLTNKERLWNAAKGAGGVIDYLTSTEGLWVTGAAVLTAGPAVEAVLTKSVDAAAAFGSVGVGVGMKGVCDVSFSDTEEEAQKGGAEILTGTLMFLGGTEAHSAALWKAK